VPKAVYCSSCRDKHNCQRRDSNLDPLTPQSDALTTRPLRPAWHASTRDRQTDRQTQCRAGRNNTQRTGRLSRGSWMLECFDMETFKFLPCHSARSRLDIAVSPTHRQLLFRMLMTQVKEQPQILIIISYSIPQCFDTVGWAAGRASGL